MRVWFKRAARTSRSLARICAYPGCLLAILSLGMQSAEAAQCGWYTVLGCYLHQRAAWRQNDQLEFGYVVLTTRKDFPFFKPGYHCVVKGPMQRAAAQATAKGWLGVVPEAYAKKAC